MNCTIRNTRGLGILSDLVWVLVFTVIAFLLFWILFQPLLEKRYERVVTVERLATDAQYIALALLERPATGGTAEGSAGRFSDAVARVLDHRASLRDDGDFSSAVDGSSYRASLDEAFGQTSGFWPGNAPPPRRAHIAVVLRQGDELLPGTCREYHAQAGSPDWICEAMADNLATTRKDPETGLAMPLLGTNTAWSLAKVGASVGPPYELGTVYIPSSRGLAAMHVLVLWEGGK